MNNQVEQNISLNTGNIFKEKELSPCSVVKESLATAADDKEYRRVKPVFRQAEIIG